MVEKKESKNEKLQKKLFLKKESGWLSVDNKEKKQIFSFSDKYKLFIKESKTERTCAKNVVSILEKNGFKNIEKITSLKTNDKVYKFIKNKAIIAFIVGKEKEVFHLVGSHMDSPRLDLKPNPLYEDGDLALLKTHYYGGIKKYQWTNTPLSLHGVIHLDGGKQITLSIGEKEDEPVFVISDLLPHLARYQLEKTGSKVVEGEQLNIIFGSIPITDKTIQEKIKFALLEKLHDEYGIIEQDFQFAELEFVPAGNPRDVGLDAGLVGAYGQDDKVCVYTELQAILDIKQPKHTAIALFVDKEEIGSVGNSGAASMLLFNFAIQYAELIKTKTPAVTILENSKAISADVTAGLDASFGDVFDPRNSSYLGRGVSIEKYGGGGGKSYTDDAHAEYMSYLRELAKKHKVVWQTGENGRIDVGGGGTIAMYISRYGFDICDIGPAVLAMHSPFEVASKFDIYQAYKMYKAFFEE